MNYFLMRKNPESGSASTKLVIALVVLVLVAHAGYNYVPVAYQGESFKQDMETSVIQGSVMATTNTKATDNVKIKLMSAMRSNGLPTDTFIEVKENNKLVTARVYYIIDVPILPFGIYTYQYVYDHTVTPSGFLVE